MPALTLYLANSTANGWRVLSELAQGAATINDGWVVSTGATNHSAYAVGVERAATTFTDTTQPDGSLDTTLKDAFRSQTAYTGTFAAGNWTFAFNVCAVTSATGQDGRIRFRLFKADADGSNATEITSTQQQASAITNLAASPGSDSSLTFNPGEFTISNQYLFVQLAWERTGAASMSAADVNWRTGQSVSLGTRITTSVLSFGGQQITSAIGSVVKVLSVALVGLSLTASQGDMSSSGGPGAILLTGSAITSATGTVVQSASRALTGIQLNGSQGSMVASGRSLIQSAQGTAAPSLTVPLVGQSSTSGQGFIFANNNGTVGPLIGIQLSALQGSVLTPGSMALTGSAITSAQGTLAPSLSPTNPVGQAITVGQGIISILSNNVTVHITGSESTFAQGNVDPRPILAGLAMTSANGTVTPSMTVPLTGSALTSSQGAMALGQDSDDTRIISGQGSIAATSRTRALTGSAMTGAQGTIGTSADASFALSGSVSTGAAGTAGATFTVPLVGRAITAGQGTMGAPGGAILTGQAITGAQGTIFTDNNRTSALTGAALVTAQGTIGLSELIPTTGQALTSGSGTLSIRTDAVKVLTGQGMTLTQGNVLAIADRALSLTGQVLIGSQGLMFANVDGSVKLLGQAMAGQQGSVVAPNVVALTGQAITSVQGSVSHPSDKSFDLTGQEIISQQGNFAVSIDQPAPVVLHVSNEGCGITVGTANEGCGLTPFGWGNLPWGDQWGGFEDNRSSVGVAKETI